MSVRNALIPLVAVSILILSADRARGQGVSFTTDKEKISGALWSCITMCAYASDVSTSTEADLKAKLKTKFGLTKVTVLRRSKYDTLAIVASNKDVVVVAFRGTVNAKNREMNADGLLVPSWRYVAYKGKHLAPPWLHRGWLKCMDDWYETLRDELKNEHNSYNKAIFITGYSLGGALAPIFAQRFIGETGGMKTSLGVHVLTFGAPVVGNQRFVDMYHDNRTKHTTHEIDHFAYYDKKDAVATRLPSGYRRHGRWRTIEKPETVELWNKDRSVKRIASVSWGSAGHDLARYELAMRLRLILDLPDAYKAEDSPPAKIGKGEKYVHIKNISWPSYLNPAN